MNRILLIVFLMVMPALLGREGGGEVVGQNAKIDSLLTVLNAAKDDTHKVNTLNRLSEYAGWQVGNFDTAFYYANTAKSLAEKLKFKKGVASSHQNIGIVHQSQGNYPKALKNYLTALRIRFEIEDKLGIANSYNGIGNVYLYQGNYPEAMKNYLASLRICKEIGDKSSIARRYNNIGLVHSTQGNYPEALENYLASLRIMEEIGNRSGMAYLFIGIGDVQSAQGNYLEALENHLTSLKIREELGDKYGMASSYNNIGNVHFQQGNYPESVKNHLASLRLREEVGDNSGIAMSYSNIGVVHHTQGNYSEALENYLASLRIQEKIGDRRGMVTTYNNIGSTCTRLNRIREGREWLTKGLSLGKEIGLKEEIKYSYESLAWVDSALGDYKGAYLNHKLYILYRDSIFNEENIKKLTQQEMQYAFDKKDALAKAEQDKKDAIATEQLRRKNQQRNAFIGGFALTLGLAGVSYRSYRRKKHDNTIITAQKEVVEKKNHAILESITYARKLQEAVLPPPKVVKEFFADSFLLYLPRDIVSGDFYWMESISSPPDKEGSGEVPKSPSGKEGGPRISPPGKEGSGEVSFFALGDCTGHGVPGAMLSVMGLNGLNRALNELHITQPADFLTQLTKDLHDAFQRSDSMVRDGMDLSICALDSTNRKLTYAGANNPLWIARNGEIIVHKPNKRPVGHHDMEGEGFSQITIDLQEGDTIYLMTDGYADQLGGPNGLKMMTKVFRERLASLSTLPLPQQREQLIADLDDWKGNGSQTDDMCVMAVRIS